MEFSWLAGGWRTAGYVASSSFLIYLSVVVGLRVGERRTLSEMTIYDFTVAVALGAIIGRTATTSSPSYVQGLVATIALLTTHHLLSVVRMKFPIVRRVVGRRPIVLVRHGVVDWSGMRSARVTGDDIHTVLREHGVGQMSDVALVVLEGRGAFSVIRASEGIDDEVVPPRLWRTDGQEINPEL